MNKYVIDLPDGISAVVAKKPYFLNETDVMRIPASQLEMYVEPSAAENATFEKRVIELPDNVIAVLKMIKEENGDDNLQGFMNDVNDDDGPWQVVEDFNFLGMPTDALLGEWWLGHVEFVPKNEPKFYIRIFDVFDVDGNDLYLASMGNNKFRVTIYTDSAGMFTEEEADKIIADVSNSDVSLTARKVKVEEK